MPIKPDVLDRITAAQFKSWEENKGVLFPQKKLELPHPVKVTRLQQLIEKALPQKLKRK